MTTSQSRVRSQTKRFECQILQDADGRFGEIIARVGCAEAVLATRGLARNEILMPRRGLVNSRLAEMSGSHGGLLKMGYDTAERELFDRGFNIAYVTAHGFLRCTERGKPDSPICRTSDCPWHLDEEEDLSGVCPMDRWKTLHP